MLDVQFFRETKGWCECKTMLSTSSGTPYLQNLKVRILYLAFRTTQNNGHIFQGASVVLYNGKCVIQFIRNFDRLAGVLWDQRCINTQIQELLCYKEIITNYWHTLWFKTSTSSHVWLHVHQFCCVSDMCSMISTYIKVTYKKGFITLQTRRELMESN